MQSILIRARSVPFGLVCCAFIFFLTGAIRAQEPAELPFTLKQVGPNVWAAISNPKAKAASVANGGFVIGDDGGVVIDPDAKAVFLGDLFWRNTLSNLVDASTRSGIETLDTLAKNQAGSTFVPGHGDVGNAQDVRAFREYLVTLQKLVADARAQGRTGDAVAEAVMPTLKEKYSQWEAFEYFAKPSILDTDAELSGKK